eukprot:CAMPEP_0196584380 /NCGR_PEP_ID=MMETSP1081-20130531/46874_1 /TAXON_ID=36882 /ORGANISM="Pyramimonas amylifera, Strain CCMP720" /LENGTH=92 /DNA_ID=CAMNT_0041905563 /DNA_START=338 /DNA_END=616 /DNA_ORIENTATION=-
MSTKSAASMATSVPAPMAIPTSAAARAGESFTPSPTIATPRGSPGWYLQPMPFWSSRTRAALPAGHTSASTIAMPSSWAMALAVPQLSPVTR